MTLFDRMKKFEPLDVFGKSIVSTTGSEWKKHRGAARNAFNEVDRRPILA